MQHPAQAAADQQRGQQHQHHTRQRRACRRDIGEDFGRSLLHRLPVGALQATGIGTQQSAVGQQVDAPRHAAAEGMHLRQRRRVEGQLSAGARQSALRKLFAFDHVNHQVTRLDVEHIKNLKQPLILHISWTAANVIRREEGRRLLELPGIIEAGLLNLSAEQDSGNPAVTTAPAICHSIISISGGGSGFRIENPRSLIPLRSGHGVSHIATLQDKGTQLLEWNCSLLPGSLASGGKASRNAFLRDSLRLMQCDWPISGSPDPAGPVASSIKSN